jgi:hypothetical protein
VHVQVRGSVAEGVASCRHSLAQRRSLAGAEGGGLVVPFRDADKQVHGPAATAQFPRELKAALDGCHVRLRIRLARCHASMLSLLARY